MVAYSFKQRFVDPIKVGLGLERHVHSMEPLPPPKRQTIRRDRKRHAYPGEELQLYHGMRTRQCFLIGRARCTTVLTIYLNVDRGHINVGGTRCRDLEHFAKRDGFTSWDEMRAFWREQHPDTCESFHGVIIFWEALAHATTDH